MNKFSKRLLSLLVVMVMLVTTLPTVFAEDPVYTDWDGDAAALVDGAYLKLTDDLVVTERYTIKDKAVTIDLNGKKITSTEAIQLMYITTGGKVTLQNGTIEMPGLATDNSTVMGGLIQANSGGVSLTLDNVTITRTTATTGLKHGGILYGRIPVQIKNSTLQVSATVDPEAATSQEGGLIKISSGCTLTIDNSTLVGTRANYGGSIFATGSGKVVINSGSVTGGSAAKLGNDIYTGNANNVIEQYGGTIGHVAIKNGTFTAFAGTLNAFSSGYASNMTLKSGVVTYQNPASVINGDLEAYVMDKSGEETKYTVYADFDAAIAAAQSGNTVSLTSNVTADQIAVPAGVTLNLYGKTLTANAVNATAEGAQIKDEKSSKNAGGKLVCSNVEVSEDNAFAPIYLNGEYHFQKFNVQSKLEGNVFKFYIADAADAVLLDDLWANGSEGTSVKLEIYVTATQGGSEKSKTFEVGTELIEQYVGGWDTKMFVLTFADLTGITNLECTARVVPA